MINYLIDASVAVEFYKPKATFHSREYYVNSRELRQRITEQKVTGKAIIFIPSFCIAEVRNILDKWFLRCKGIFHSQQHYETAFENFISHVHDRKFFYSYDLNRYHNLNVNEVTFVEHTTETEFDATGLPIGTYDDTINDELRKRNPRDHVSKYYLSTFDILIIAMGIELKRIHGEEVHLLTADKRLFSISSKKPGMFPKPYYWPKLRVAMLPME